MPGHARQASQSSDRLLHVVCMVQLMMDLGLAPVNEVALNEAVSFIESTTDAVAVIAAGTIIRGVPDKNSDLDIYVLHDAPWRCRIQRYFNGVATEIFVNRFDHVYTYFVDEDRKGRPMTAHMLATGVVLRGADDGRVVALVEAAKE